MSNSVAHALGAALADTYVLRLKTQNYHWNVEGPHFRSLHGLFEEQYTELTEALDEIAERIRALGEKIDATHAALTKKSGLKDGDYKLDDAGMVKDLFESNLKAVESMKTALKAAQEVDDEFSADMMIGRIGTHEKAAWMLRSTLPDAVRSKIKKAADY